MATKLQLFALTRFESILYLDADALLTGDPAPIFRLLAPRADGAPAAALAAEAARVPAGTFNAGVLVLRPSNVTLDALMERAKLPPPTIYSSTVDCTEQALLNSFFDGSTPARTVITFDVAHPDEHTGGSGGVHTATSSNEAGTPPANTPAARASGFAHARAYNVMTLLCTGMECSLQSRCSSTQCS